MDPYTALGLTSFVILSIALHLSYLRVGEVRFSDGAEVYMIRVDQVPSFIHRYAVGIPACRMTYIWRGRHWRSGDIIAFPGTSLANRLSRRLKEHIRRHRQ